MPIIKRPIGASEIYASQVSGTLDGDTVSKYIAFPSSDGKGDFYLQQDYTKTSTEGSGMLSGYWSTKHSPFPGYGQGSTGIDPRQDGIIFVPGDYFSLSNFYDYITDTNRNSINSSSIMEPLNLSYNVYSLFSSYYNGNSISSSFPGYGIILTSPNQVSNFYISDQRLVDITATASGFLYNDRIGITSSFTLPLGLSRNFSSDIRVYYLNPATFELESVITNKSLQEQLDRYGYGNNWGLTVLPVAPSPGIGEHYLIVSGSANKKFDYVGTNIAQQPTEPSANPPISLSDLYNGAFIDINKGSNSADVFITGSSWSNDVTGTNFYVNNQWFVVRPNNNNIYKEVGRIKGATAASVVQLVTYINKDDESLSAGTDTLNQSIYTFRGEQIVNAFAYQGQVTDPSKLTDFRTTIKSLITVPGGKNKIKTILSDSPSYSSQSIETRTGIGNPGYRQGKDLTDYSVGASNGAASISSYDTFNTAGTSSINDLVDFQITVGGVLLRFRAFLNSISDSFTADWKGEKFIGRAENFYTYTGFDRKFSLSWMVAAQSRIEMDGIYQKLNTLASSCAPAYNNGYMTGPISYLKVGNYINTYGIINKVSYEISEEYPWEINIDKDGKQSNIGQKPQVINVTGFEFTPIHSFVPRVGSTFIN